MTELDKFNLMLQGGYNPMGGGITTNQMEDFKTAGLFNQIQDTNNRISSLNIPNNPNPVPNTADEDLLKKQKRANMLIAFGDLLRGKDATAGFTQRQAMFDAERERAERKAKQEQRLQQQEEFIKNNPQFEQLIRFNQLFGMDMPQPKNPRIINQGGINYYEDGSKVLPNIADKQPTAKQIYDNLAADIKTTVANKGVEALTENQKTFYNTYLLRQNSGGFDKFLLDYIRGQGDSNKTANETGIIDTGERTPDGKKIVEKDGKRFVQVD